MVILIIILVIILMFHLNSKGKAYREEKRDRRLEINQMTGNIKEAQEIARRKQEAEYRKDLERQGFDEDLIAIILPVVMSGK